MCDGTHRERHADKHTVMVHTETDTQTNTQRDTYTHTSTLYEEAQCELRIQEQRDSGKVTKVQQTQRTKTLNMCPFLSNIHAGYNNVIANFYSDMEGLLGRQVSRTPWRNYPD